MDYLAQTIPLAPDQTRVVILGKMVPLINLPLYWTGTGYTNFIIRHVHTHDTKAAWL